MAIKPLLCILLFCCSLLSAHTSWSQDQSTSVSSTSSVETASTKPKPDLVKQTFDKKLSDIEAQDKDIASLNKELDTLKGERKASLHLRIVQKALKLLSAYDDITAFTLEQKKSGYNTDNFTKILTPKMMPIGPKIRKSIIRKETEINEQSHNIDDLSAEGIRIFKDRQEYIDLALRVLSKHVNNLEQLALDNNQSRNYLEEELLRRAETLIGQLQLLTQEQSQVESALLVNSTNQDLLDKKQSYGNKISVVTGSMKNTISLLENNGLPTDTFKREMIVTTGTITSDILNPEIFKGLMSDWSQKSLNYIKSHSADFIFKIVVFTLVVLLFKLISRFFKKMLKRALSSDKIDVSSLMEEMLLSTVSRTVMFIGILIGLSQIGISLGPLLAGLGVAGFIIGFALQDTLGNFASGMMILFYRPYDVGDMVIVSGNLGKVKSMNLVSTTILTIDNQTLVIPNNKIWGDVITNLTGQRVRRVDMTFGVSYSDSIEKVEAILHEVVSQHDRILNSPAPDIHLHTLNESSVDFIVRPWVRTDDYWDVYWDITREVKIRFDAEGVSIPFPQRDVHLYQHQGESQHLGQVEKA